MTLNKYTEFSKISIGERFTYNGNTYVKHSTRTAQLVMFGNKVFYFSQNALVGEV